MVSHDKQLLTVNVIDKRWNGRAGRVRVQTQGDLHGKVLMPAQYQLIEFIT